MEYKVVNVKANSFDEAINKLEKFVNDYISCGWNLEGNLCFQQNYRGEFYLLQVLVRHSEY